MPSRDDAADQQNRTALSRNLGPVMAIGGAERKDRDGSILSRFLEHAGNKRASLLVIPTASEDPEGSGQESRKGLLRMGAKKVSILQVASRTDANSGQAIEAIQAASGVSITGGDQARLVAMLVGTRAMDALRDRNAAGVIVAGTSAGPASIEILADSVEQAPQQAGRSERAAALLARYGKIMVFHDAAPGSVIHNQ